MKLTIVGGGSSMFVPTLMRRILVEPCLAGSTIFLMDVDSARLDVMGSLARALIEAEKRDFQIETTTDRAAALIGADFVIVAISAGGMAAWEQDIEIPARYGVFMQIADSIGPAGMMRAFRNAPALAAITRELRDLSPRAWVFNYSNPASAMTMAMRTTPEVSSVSLCSCTPLASHRGWLATLSGLAADDFVLPPIVGGINHCAGITRLRLRDGTDALPAFRARASDPFVEFAYDNYGVLAYCSNHWAEFYPQLQHLEDRYSGRAQGLAMKYGLRIYDMADQRQRMERWQRLAERWTRPENAGEVSLANLPAGDEDFGIEVIDVIASIVENRNRVFVVNTVNHGSIPNLPEDAIVEVSALVNAYGIHPIYAGPISEAWAAHLRRHIATQRLTVEAALSGDRHTARLAFLHDALLEARLEPKDVGALLDEMLAANVAFLPQFTASTPRATASL